MWFMASATANRYELVADLDEHIKFEGSGSGVKKEYLLIISPYSVLNP